MKYKYKIPIKVKLKIYKYAREKIHFWFKNALYLILKTVHGYCKRRESLFNNFIMSYKCRIQIAVVYCG